MLRGWDSLNATFASDEYIADHVQKFPADWIKEDNAQFKKKEEILQVLDAQDIRKPTPCICDRPKALVVCALCGSFGNGRVAKICPKHPHTEFSTDVQKCSVCTFSRYLRECPYPENYDFAC